MDDMDTVRRRTDDAEDSGNAAELISRRRFLGHASGLLSAAIAGALGLPLVRFFVGHSFAARAAKWLKLGPVEEMLLGEPQLVRVSRRDSDGWRQLTRRESVYVVTDDGVTFSVFSAACTHLGCPVRWDNAEQSFLCPCHNGGFARDGAVAKGPPPRPLDKLEHKVEAGILYVRLG